MVRANGTLLAQGGGLFGGSVLGAKAYPGDLIFVPVDAIRGEFWAGFATFRRRCTGNRSGSGAGQ